MKTSHMVIGVAAVAAIVVYRRAAARPAALPATTGAAPSVGSFVDTAVGGGRMLWSGLSGIVVSLGGKPLPAIGPEGSPGTGYTTRADAGGHIAARKVAARYDFNDSKYSETLMLGAR